MSAIDTSYSNPGLGAESSSNSGNSESASSSTSLSYTDYLSLFLTELENQDPTEPMSTTDMVAQTYYFSQLELTGQTNEYLQSLLESQESSSNLTAAQLIGHSVLAEGNTINVSEGSSSSINFELDENAENVEIEIYDGDGNLVDSINLEDLPSGEHEISWDAVDTEGEPVEDGDYHYTVTASDSSGAEVDATAYSNVTICSVSIKDGEVYLDTLGGEQLDMDDIVKVL